MKKAPRGAFFVEPDSAQLDDFIAVGDVHARAAQHDRGRAVLFGGQFHRAPDLRLLQTTALDHEAQVNAGEYLGVFVRALRLEKGLAAFHRLSGLDRKSTRLNSSHVRISYAVFCLK